MTWRSTCPKVGRSSQPWDGIRWYSARRNPHLRSQNLSRPSGGLRAPYRIPTFRPSVPFYTGELSSRGSVCHAFGRSARNGARDKGENGSREGQRSHAKSMDVACNSEGLRSQRQVFPVVGSHAGIWDSVTPRPSRLRAVGEPRNAEPRKPDNTW